MSAETPKPTQERSVNMISTRAIIMRAIKYGIPAATISYFSYVGVDVQNRIDAAHNRASAINFPEHLLAPPPPPEVVAYAAMLNPLYKNLQDAKDAKDRYIPNTDREGQILSDSLAASEQAEIDQDTNQIDGIKNSPGYKSAMGPYLQKVQEVDTENASNIQNWKEKVSQERNNTGVSGYEESVGAASPPVTVFGSIALGTLILFSESSKRPSFPLREARKKQSLNRKEQA